MKKYTCKKAKGRKTVQIVQLDKEDWFYSVKHISSGKIVEQGMIIKNQIPLYTTKYKGAGDSIVIEDI
jgi:hypothetical protein